MGLLWLDDRPDWGKSGIVLGILVFFGLAWWGLVELVLWLIPVIKVAIWG